MGRVNKIIAMFHMKDINTEKFLVVLSAINFLSLIFVTSLSLLDLI